MATDDSLFSLVQHGRERTRLGPGGCVSVSGSGVRLYQGNDTRVAGYADNLLAESGAHWLHALDLDGVKAGYPTLARRHDQTLLQVEHVFQAALLDRALLLRVLQHQGERIIAAFDAHDRRRPARWLASAAQAAGGALSLPLSRAIEPCKSPIFRQHPFAGQSATNRGCNHRSGALYRRAQPERGASIHGTRRETMRTWRTLLCLNVNGGRTVKRAISGDSMDRESAALSVQHKTMLAMMHAAPGRRRGTGSCNFPFRAFAY